MGILSIVARNFFRRARTRAPGDLPPIPPGFRGMIEHEATRCTGCGTCVYVCPPAAISIDGLDSTQPTWRFFAGQCSFCGLCVQFCPTRAIVNGGKLPPVTGDQGQHRVVHPIPTQPCARCGTTIIPMPDEVLRELYGEQMPAAVRREYELCTECRRAASSQRLRDAFVKPGRHDTP
jgi:hydrogenase-4 component H